MSADETTQASRAVPLLRAVAVQRSVSDLLQLALILDAGDQSGHAQEILTTAATLRPVQDVAVMVRQLAGAQAMGALTAAAGRPLEELAELVGHLHSPAPSSPGTRASSAPKASQTSWPSQTPVTSQSAHAAQPGRWKLHR